MRIALISDIHGNDAAFQAVIRDLAAAEVDRTIFLGDAATLGPQPTRVIARLRNLNCDCIMGNHDEFLIDAELIKSYTSVKPVVDAVHWCREQIGDDDVAFIKTFKHELELQLSPAVKMLLVHGTPRSYYEELLATTPADEVDAMLDNREAAIIAGGHTHLQMLRQHHGMLLVNPGSAGMPFRDFAEGREPIVLPHAEYAIIEVIGENVRVDLRRVTYDTQVVYRVMEQSTHPMRSMLMAAWGND